MAFFAYRLDKMNRFLIRRINLSAEKRKTVFRGVGITCIVNQCASFFAGQVNNTNLSTLVFRMILS
jgi:hypothetical protein